MNKFIPLSVPNLNGNELKYVTNAVEMEWVSTGGSYINEFETNISRYLKIDKAVACQSGTSAIHLALILSNIGKNDEVIVPTLTFIASVNPIKYVGAEPIFMDCDESLNIDLDKLQEFCENECVFQNNVLINKKTNKVIKAIIVVHIFGNVINMEKLMEISKKYNLIIIEDATEALGSYIEDGKYKGKFAGTIGDFGIFSFNGNKIITTGGGGLLVSNNNKLLEKAKYLSTQAKDDEINYIHNEIGYNYRMTNLQAALGVAQLETLEKFINVKNLNYNLYKDLLNCKDYYLLEFNKNVRSNYWFYSLFLKNDKLDKDKLIKKLLENNIQSRPIWGLIHNQKPYLNCQTYKIEKAEFYSKKVVNIPCSTKLTTKEVKFVSKTIKEILDEMK